MMKFFILKITIVFIFIYATLGEEGDVGNRKIRGCEIEVIVDPFLHQHFLDLDTKYSPAVEIRRLIIEKISLLVNHANVVLKRAHLDPFYDYELVIKRIKILDFENCVYKGLNYCSILTENASELLNFHSSTDHRDICLSYLFTYKNFDDSTLGLAWRATDGGICSQTRNTGLITFLHNYNDIDVDVASIAFAHEIGHSFGSNHDSNQDCLKSQLGGHYLMHPRAALGSFHSLLHQDFSPCSIQNISEVLGQILVNHGTLRDCFKEAPGSICGNGIVEGWEECDCGETESDCRYDLCCHPASTSPSSYACQLTTQAQCSPSEGPCCSHDCQTLPRGTPCLDETTCEHKSSCDGSSLRCPVPESKPDGTSCSDGAKICENGICSGSICSKFNMIPCIPEFTPCEVHCKSKQNSDICTPSSKLIVLFPEPVYYPRNTGCDLGNTDGKSNETGSLGYCSSYGKCQEYLETHSASTVVGIAFFLIMYLIMTGIGIWIYFRYCKGRRIKPANGVIVNVQNGIEEID